MALGNDTTWDDVVIQVSGSYPYPTGSYDSFFRRKSRYLKYESKKYSRFFIQCYYLFFYTNIIKGKDLFDCLFVLN